MNKKHRFSGISSFELDAQYHETDKEEMVSFSHVHEECEIYINISGDVSFAVENRIYPIEPGSIIITRPFEYHRCIYHSEKLHRHFCFFFSCKGNEFLLDSFFKRDLGQNNHLKLRKEETKQLVKLCSEITQENVSEQENFYRFFQLLHYLQKAEHKGTEGSYPSDVLYVVDYVGRHYTEPICVEKLAKDAGVSINTLERHFSDCLHMTPMAYIRQKKLAIAAQLLSEGKTVSETAEMSGFSDYSGFIALFKKNFGVTPLKYKQQEQKGIK